MRRRILSENVSDEKIFLFFSLLGKSIPHLVLLSARRRTIYWRTADYEHRGEGGVERMGGPLWSPVVPCVYSPQGPLSPTVLGHPCIEGRREAWHPQGPIHPQPHPVPLHVVHPRSHARRAVVWWRGGSLKCSGTGWQGGVVGPLRVPGLTVPRLTASARAAILLPTTRPLPSNAPSPPPAPRQSDRATAQPEARAPASNGASTPQRSPGAVAKYFLVLECSAPAKNAPQPRAAPTTP